MKGAINQDWLNVTSFDSGAPSGGATVVHRFDAPGEYRVRVVHGDETLAQTVIAVSGGQPAETGAGPGHVSLDMKHVLTPANLSGTPTDRERAPLVVRTQGYVSFTDSGRTKPFAIVAEAPAGGGPGFDSRRLGPGDVFAVTLLRPGKYRMTNELSRATGEITIAYPVVGTTPYRPPEPQAIECTDRGFQPSSVALKPAQGAIFRIQTAARIKVELTEPDDGPSHRPDRVTDRPQPRVRISREAVLRAIDRVRANRDRNR